MSNNPYAGFGKVVTGERLVGRDDSVNEVVSRLSDHDASIAVIGNPRIGKTSLISEVVNRLNQSSLPVIRFWIDLSTVPNSMKLFCAICDELYINWARKIPSVPSSISIPNGASLSDAYDAYRNAKRILTMLTVSGIRTQIVIDEFDAIRTFNDAAITIQRLRDLI
jgi:hypothetical protein